MPDIGSEIKPVSSWDEEGDKTIESNDDSTNQPAHSAEVQVPAGDVYARWALVDFNWFLRMFTVRSRQCIFIVVMCKLKEKVKSESIQKYILNTTCKSLSTDKKFPTWPFS